MAPYLIPELKSRFGALGIIKKSCSYFAITCDKITFKDAILFTSPTSLSGYLKQNGVTETKSIWPYGHYHDVSSIESDKEFPSYECFYSELRGKNIDRQLYLDAKSEFYLRQNLPENHPKKIKTMKCWLENYNLLDVIPLSKAIDHSFQSYFDVFGIDPATCYSLPKFAQLCVFQLYSKTAPLCYSFARKSEDVRTLFRQNILGGLVNVFSRFTDINPYDWTIPHAATHAPNGDPFTQIIFLDFNAMYLWSQKQPMPTTPGIHWELKRRNGNSYFRKKIMSYGNSLGAVQWLYFIQDTSDLLVDKNGVRVQLQHQYYRGEKNYNGFLVDGYACVDGAHVFFEYLGCWYHKCPTCSPGKS